MIAGLPVATAVAVAWCVGIAVAELAAPAGAPPPVLAATAAALALAVAAGLALRPAWPALLLAALLAGGLRAGAVAGDPGELARAQALAGKSMHVVGVVVDDPRDGGAGAQLLVDPASGYGRVLVRSRLPVEAAIGDAVDARGVLHLPARSADFDRRAYLAQRGAHLEMTAAELSVGHQAGGPRAFPAWLRSTYRSAIGAVLPPPHAAVLVGIVLGDRSGVPRRLNQELIATGLVHLLVLSGLKVAVFARLAAAALAPLLGARAPLPVAALIGVYALAGGATPAAVRAAAMGGVALLATAAGRPTHVWTSLAMTAAAMLGWRPEWVFDVGFQLSFLGTAAIILLTPGIEARLHFLPRPIREPFAVTCAAQLGTVPVMAQGFHVLSPVAPLANAAVLPLLAPVVAAGLLLPALAVAPVVGQLAAMPLAFTLTYVEHVAALLATVPAAAIPIPGFPPWGAVAYYGAGVAAIAAVRQRGRRRTALALASVAVAAVVAATQLPDLLRPPPEAAFFSVGDGQAVLLRGPNGLVLIDGGPSPSALAGALGERMRPWERSLDALVITGAGQAEIGGLAGLAPVARRVLVPRAPLEGTAWRSVVYEQRARGATVSEIAAGDTFLLAGLSVEALAPDPRVLAGDRGAAALALRISYPSGRSVCVFGPLDLAAQVQAARRLTGRCDQLLVAGAGRSLPAPELLRIARPEALVVSSSGGRMARGLPEAIVRRTDQEGTIVVRP